MNHLSAKYNVVCQVIKIVLLVLPTYFYFHQVISM